MIYIGDYLIIYKNYYLFGCNQSGRSPREGFLRKVSCRVMEGIYFVGDVILGEYYGVLLVEERFLLV